MENDPRTLAVMEPMTLDTAREGLPSLREEITTAS